MTSAEEWLYQLSLKSSPDAPMLNIRAFTARDLAEQVTELAEYAPQIGARLEEIKAVQALAGAGMNPTRIPDGPGRPAGGYDRTRGNSRTNGGNSKGEDTDQVCEVHGQPMQRKSGTKNGKSWSGLFCSATRNPCSPVWDD